MRTLVAVGSTSGPIRFNRDCGWAIAATVEAGGDAGGRPEVVTRHNAGHRELQQDLRLDIKPWEFSRSFKPTLVDVIYH